MGTAFVSTLYGLALANLVLLPAAHRMRVTAENEAQADELISEGVLGIYDQVHPTLLRDRLQGFVRGHRRTSGRLPIAMTRHLPEAAQQNRWMVSYLDVLTILLIFFIAAAAASLKKVPPSAAATVSQPAASSAAEAFGPSEIKIRRVRHSQQNSQRRARQQKISRQRSAGHGRKIES